MAKIVLLAPSGQVGFELARTLSPLGEVLVIGRKQVDFADIDKLKALVAENNPTVIVNASAYTMVDKAESEQEQAFLLNAEVPKVLAQIANEKGALLVHYSSDYVYPGNGEQAWRENDDTAPLSVYGQSKLAGDKAIMDNCSNYLIFRTSWVYASRGNNFMKTMIKLAQSRDSLNIVNDQIGSPTPARLIAQVSALAIVKKLQNPSEFSGIYHLAPKGFTSWYEFAKEIFNLARQADLTLALDDNKVAGISTEQYPTPAKRPKNSRLDTTKLEQTFGLTLPTWQNQLKLTFDEWLAYQ